MAQTNTLEHTHIATEISEEGAAQPSRVAVAAAWVVCGVSVASAVATVVLQQLNKSDWYRGTLMLSVLASAAMGMLIVARRGPKAVGWLLLLGALGFGMGNTAIQYALYGTLTRPGALPLVEFVAWLSMLLNQGGGWCLVLFLPILFPDGRPLSSAWRRVIWCLVALAIGSTLIFALLPGPLQNIPALSSPVSLTALLPFRDAINAGSIFVLLASLLFPVTSLVIRYRRSASEERLQIKWLTFAVVAWIALVLPSGWVEATHPQLFLVLDWLITLAFSGIPIAIGIAVLRYRLYDIDLIINRTLVYAALTLCIGSIYVLLVIGLGALLQNRANTALTLLATGTVAVLFAPLRDSLQRHVNRLLYGARAEPYTALARLGQRLEATLAPDAVLPTIVQTVAETLRLPYAAIMLTTTEHQRAQLGAEHGELPINLSPSQLASLPLTYQGEEVGRLLLAPRTRNERLNEADWHLLRDLARQAGAAVHAVQLTAALQTGLVEVRRSREQIVTAQEEERRRIQRDLHDGLGPVLASMRMRLEACLDQAQTGAPDLVYDLERLDVLVGQATTDIRRLVYDLRPPALDQLGLVRALLQHANRFSRETNIAVEVIATVDHALPAAVEVTIYRIASEALTNIHKYAAPTEVTITLQQLGDALLLRINDNGTGGAVEGAYEGGGTGMRSMRERAELLGGAFVLRSPPGVGTTIEVYLPLREEAL